MDEEVYIYIYIYTELSWVCNGGYVFEAIAMKVLLIN